VEWIPGWLKIYSVNCTTQSTRPVLNKIQDCTEELKLAPKNIKEIKQTVYHVLFCKINYY
jgi:hypothetical protein